MVGWRLSSHSLCVSSILRSTLVCSPNGPKSQDTGGAAAAEAAGTSGPERGPPPPRSVGIYAIASLNKHKTESIKRTSRHKAESARKEKKKGGNTHLTRRKTVHPSKSATSSCTFGLRARSSHTIPCLATVCPDSCGAPRSKKPSASLNHPRSSTICHTGPAPTLALQALPILRVINEADAYAFVGTVSFGAKSCGGRCRRSTRTVAVDAAFRAAADAVGPTKSGTGRWRWWMFGFGSA